MESTGYSQTQGSIAEFVTVFLGCRLCALDPEVSEGNSTFPNPTRVPSLQRTGVDRDPYEHHSG